MRSNGVVLNATRRPPRVLVVAYHFPPEGSVGTHRTLRLVRSLTEQGWSVTVLTGTRSTYSSGCVIDAGLLDQVPEGVRVVRAPALRPFERLSAALKPLRKTTAARGDGSASDAAATRNARPGSITGGLRRRLQALAGIPDSHAGWLLPAVLGGVAAAARQRPDVIYSTAPPWTGQLVARTLASVLRCAWVADFRDPWARAPWREGRLPIARVAAEVCERSVVRRADAVVFTTRTNLNEYANFYGAATAAKFHLVRNGCSRDEFDGLPPIPRDRRFTMLHAGSLYGGRKPSALFAALAALRDRGVISARSFRLRQIGRVALTGFDIAAERRRLTLDEIVEITPAQPRRQILREMMSASCLLLLQPGTTVSIPGKLFEYLATGRPILSLSEEGETSELVRASGNGLAVLPDDQAAIERAIEALVTGRQPAGPSWRPELFDGDLRTRELVAVLESAGRLAAAEPSAAGSTSEAPS